MVRPTMAFNILNPDTFKPPLRSPIPNSKADIGTVLNV
jgi:hypothetical protein